MTFWRMQLHPDNASEAMRHAVKSLAADYVGLDFETEVGDLTRITKEQMEQLAAGQKKYRAFADEMAEGDKVLIMVHNFPFALVTIDGDYNYIRKLISVSRIEAAMIPIRAITPRQFGEIGADDPELLLNRSELKAVAAAGGDELCRNGSLAPQTETNPHSRKTRRPEIPYRFLR